ncbi:MAG: glycosyltransferase [bacterium]
MRILHVTPYFYGAWAYGGIPRLSYELARAQAALGHQVHAVTTDAMDENHRQDKPVHVPGLEVRVYPNLSNYMAYHYQFFCPRRLRAERKRAGHYDIVHVHGHRNLLNTRMAAYAFHAGVPVVLEPNGTLVNIERRQFAKRVYDLVWGSRQVRRTSAFAAVSKAEASQMEAIGISRSCIRVLPNGVQMDSDDQARSFKNELGIHADYVLYLGKITPRKGIEHAITALSRLSDKNLLLVIAGNDMGYAGELKRLAEELGISDRVIFTGLVTGPLKASAYQEARYTVYAGRDEIFGLVPWESILCGTPVIVADDSGCGEWIKEAQAGYVVPYGDSAAIADIIEQGDSEKEMNMVERGQSFCRDRLSWSRIAKEMIEYYEEVRGWMMSS